jgi:glycerol-3-phosphate dehydrogenase (NAD(P)+)
MADHCDYAVIGAGSWGTALAKLISENGRRTLLWGRDAEAVREMQSRRVNRRYLPDIDLPGALHITADLSEALAAATPLIVVPSGAFRALIADNRAAFQKAGRLAWATKGLEEHNALPLDRVAREQLGADVKLAVISGPNFAREVARGVPSATTVASEDAGFAGDIVNALHNDWFRAYTSTDMAGVQVSGALKNALAIASGICDGLDFGANTRAALLTRGLAEMTRLAVAMGGEAETMIGLSGIGDVLLTCTDNQSRNRRFGLMLAEGLAPEAARARIGQVVEGARSAAVGCALARRYGVELPIIEQVNAILNGEITPREAVQALLSREPTSES